MSVKNNKSEFPDVMATVELCAVKSGRGKFSLEKSNESRHYIILQKVRLIYPPSLSENTKHRLSTSIGSTSGLQPKFNWLMRSFVSIWDTSGEKNTQSCNLKDALK